MPAKGTCAVCGKIVARNRTSLPQGEATCQPCKRATFAERHTPNVGNYTRGCRCDGCRKANTLYCGDRKGRSATERPCRICGTRFVSRIPAQSNCSDECRRESMRMHHSTRRALRRNASVGEPVVPAQVFARDSWRCHICRRKISPDRAHPHPRSASIDHLVPLSKGGAHVPENVATACLRCNIAKNNRGGNEQLLLIG